MRLDDVSTLTLMFNSVSIDAGDPGGLTEAEWKENPRQAPRADQYNTRKSLDQTQAGLRYQRQMSERDELTLTAYHGERHTTQYQSIPMGPQLNPTHAGGVIVLERKYQGIDTRWKHEDTLASLPVTLIGGLDYETMTERRQGFENFILRDGTVDYGEKGDQRRNEKNRIWNLDPYLQTSATDAALDAGCRPALQHGQLRLDRLLHHAAQRRRQRQQALPPVAADGLAQLQDQSGVEPLSLRRPRL